MATVKVMAGVCGFNTTIKATAEREYGPVHLEIVSECPHITKLAAELTDVNSLKEIAYRGEGPQTLRLAAKYLPHAACVVPPSIIKAIEVAAGLALPKDPNISVSRD
jgi:hypothetical protein